MNNDLFAEFSAQFDKPEETLLEQRERIQKEQGITNKPATIKASELTDEEIQKRRLEAGFLSNETEKKFFDQADQIIQVERPLVSEEFGFPAVTKQDIKDHLEMYPPKPFAVINTYPSMPQGLKEAQERNGIRDHSLGLRKGDFVWADKKKKDKVIFKESDTGAFSVLDPNNPNEATKDLLDRKFPSADYIGSIDPYSGDSEGIVTIYKGTAKGSFEPVLSNKYRMSPEELYKEMMDTTKNHNCESIIEASSGITPVEVVDNSIKISVNVKEEPLGFDIEMPEVQGEILFAPSTRKAFGGEETDEALFMKSPPAREEGVFKIVDRKIEAKPIYSAPIEAEAGAKIWIGVDPGKKGAIVAVASNGMVGKWPIPLIQDDVDAVGIWNILNDLKSRYDLTLILEDVHSLFGMSAATNFSMGHTLGILDGIIAASKIRLIRVPPKTWQKEIWEKNDMQYKPLKDEQKKPSVDTKATSMKAARRLFPEADLRATARSRNDSDGICDSACLAEYGRRKNL